MCSPGPMDLARRILKGMGLAALVGIPAACLWGLGGPALVGLRMRLGRRCGEAAGGEGLRKFSSPLVPLPAIMLLPSFNFEWVETRLCPV